MSLVKLRKYQGNVQLRSLDHFVFTMYADATVILWKSSGVGLEGHSPVGSSHLDTEDGEFLPATLHRGFSLAPIGQGSVQHLPEPERMFVFQKMGQFVDDHIVDEADWKLQ